MESTFRQLQELQDWNYNNIKHTNTVNLPWYTSWWNTGCIFYFVNKAVVCAVPHQIHWNPFSRMNPSIWIPWRTRGFGFRISLTYCWPLDCTYRVSSIWKTWAYSYGLLVQLFTSQQHQVPQPLRTVAFFEVPSIPANIHQNFGEMIGSSFPFTGASLRETRSLYFIENHQYTCE